MHDTLQEVGMSPAQFRPFIHSYATATLMGEGMSSRGVGTNWSWPRYCTSQFRKSNAFGAVKGKIRSVTRQLDLIGVNGKMQNENVAKADPDHKTRHDDSHWQGRRGAERTSRQRRARRISCSSC